MTMPNFLIIGAAKSGTTALYRYLAQHPEIYTSPIKEPDFFAYEGENPKFYLPSESLYRYHRLIITDIENYLTLFRDVSDETAIGEASTIYLYSPRASERIQHYIPDAKLIAILRNPVERAYSQFLHGLRDGHEPLTDFAQVLEEEAKRIESNWSPFYHYRQQGFYYTLLKRYFDRFDYDQIRVYLYDDWKADNLNILRDVFHFLNVDDTFVPDVSQRHNVSGVSRVEILHRFLNRPNPIKAFLKPLLPQGLHLRITPWLRNANLRRPDMPPQVRKQLIEVYREDILKLESLIGRNLAGWLEYEH
jgi:hypothetical protein